MVLSRVCGIESSKLQANVAGPQSIPFLTRISKNYWVKFSLLQVLIPSLEWIGVFLHTTVPFTSFLSTSEWSCILNFSSLSLPVMSLWCSDWPHEMHTFCYMRVSKIALWNQVCDNTAQSSALLWNRQVFLARGCDCTLDSRTQLWTLNSRTQLRSFCAYGPWISC